VLSLQEEIKLFSAKCICESSAKVQKIVQLIACTNLDTQHNTVNQLTQHNHASLAGLQCECVNFGH